MKKGNTFRLKANLDDPMMLFLFNNFYKKNNGYMFVYVGYFLTLLLLIIRYFVMKLFFHSKDLSMNILLFSFLLPIVIINIHLFSSICHTF